MRAYCTQNEKPMETTMMAIVRARLHVAAERRLGDAVDDERDEDGREGQLHVGHPHDQRVEPAASVARHEPERDAERTRGGDAEHADEERQPQAVEDGREHVAALVVRADEERALPVGAPQRRQVRVDEVELRGVVGVLRGDQRGGEREGEEEDGDERRAHRQLGGAEARDDVGIEEAGESRRRRDAGWRYLAHAARPAWSRRRGSTTV